MLINYAFSLGKIRLSTTATINTTATTLPWNISLIICGAYLKISFEPAAVKPPPNELVPTVRKIGRVFKAVTFIEIFNPVPSFFTYTDLP